MSSVWAPKQWAPESQGWNSGRRLLPLAGFGWKVCARFVGWLFLGVLRVVCGHSSTLTAWQKVTQGNSWWAGDRGEADKLGCTFGFSQVKSSRSNQAKRAWKHLFWVSAGCFPRRNISLHLSHPWPSTQAHICPKYHWGGRELCASYLCKAGKWE